MVSGQWSMLDVGLWMDGGRMLATGCWMLDAGYTEQCRQEG